MSPRARIEKMDCMTDGEWAMWLAAARESGRGGALGIRPCHDCTRDFAAKMQAQERCNGVPGRWRDMNAAEHRRHNMLLMQRRREAAA